MSTDGAYDHRPAMTTAYFNRPGPRLVDSLEILAEILYLGLFAPCHAATRWERLDGVIAYSVNGPTQIR